MKDMVAACRVQLGTDASALGVALFTWLPVRQHRRDDGWLCVHLGRQHARAVGLG